MTGHGRKQLVDPLLNPLTADVLDQIREHGGLIGIRDENALESALARARQRWSYDEVSDLPRLAADSAYGISSNHPFRDGNKRTAFAATDIFLGMNGLVLTARQDDAVDFILGLYETGEFRFEKLEPWLRANTDKR